jgi:hypothetical protein
MIAWVRIHADPSRTVMIATQKPRVDMIQHGGDKRFIIFWHAKLVGWIICWKQGVEKTVKFASTYETDVSDLHRPIWSPWTWLPQSMSVRRILDGKLFTEDVVVGHREPQESRKPLNARGGGHRITVEEVIQRTRASNVPNTPPRQCNPPKMAPRPAPAASAD